MAHISCDYDCADGYDEYWEELDNENHFQPMPEREQQAKCDSCGRMIDAGELVVTFTRFRPPKDDDEESEYGDEVPLDNAYYCESCGEIYINLNSIGYCITFGGNIREALEEYWQITGFDPAKYTNNSVEAEG